MEKSRGRFVLPGFGYRPGPSWKNFVLPVDDVDDVDRGRKTGHHWRDFRVPFLVLQDDPIAELTGTGQPRLVGEIRIKEETGH